MIWRAGEIHFPCSHITIIGTETRLPCHYAALLMKDTVAN